jgi:hypothetical protein
MPTVLREGPYWFFFYSADLAEPPHIHVERDVSKATFWLDPVRLENNRGFGRSELNRIRRLVEENVSNLLRSWNGFFESQAAAGEGTPTGGN